MYVYLGFVSCAEHPVLPGHCYVFVPRTAPDIPIFRIPGTLAGDIITVVSD